MCPIHRPPVGRLLQFSDDGSYLRHLDDDLMQPVYDNLVGRFEAVISADAERRNLNDEGNGRHEPGPVRPTGRARRGRQPYTITAAVRETNWFQKSLEFDDRAFRVIYRVSKQTYWSIVGLICGNNIFKSRGRRKQRPVHHQLGVFLIRYGVMGSRANMGALLTSVGEGTVILYCRRVVRAIREFGLTCVGWPNRERKEVIKAAFKELCGLDGIIGALDGSLIKLAKRPPESDASFISRKGTTATNVQAIVDHEGRFIAFETGYAGSKNDTYVWKHSYVFRHRDTHFQEGEFVLADGAGYPISPFVLTPFARNECQEDGDRKRRFGKLISSARVVIEQTFGRLKARFPSLALMGEVEDLDDLYRAIEAMMILHNMCYDLHDTVSGVPDQFTEHNLAADDGELYDEVGQEPADADWGQGVNINEPLLEAGRAWRARCMDIVCLE
ncbi:hypothetical protein CTheo_5245 [Ceratobasidium theobromae]|uniref:DDE Tnp4 domain-containing protein n=1 Tax=Ceratobasidium theobromae TaxID=1582974 RepID=A0A5N5QI74_9AGAM|nr:hypothetical protein CTheo_5245 [Ceratobasidium theobromae]